MTIEYILFLGNKIIISELQIKILGEFIMKNTKVYFENKDTGEIEEAVPRMVLVVTHEDNSVTRVGVGYFLGELSLTHLMGKELDVNQLAVILMGYSRTYEAIRTYGGLTRKCGFSIEDGYYSDEKELVVYKEKNNEFYVPTVVSSCKVKDGIISQGSYIFKGYIGNLVEFMIHISPEVKDIFSMSVEHTQKWYEETEHVWLGVFGLVSMAVKKPFVPGETIDKFTV